MHAAKPNAVPERRATRTMQHALEVHNEAGKLFVRCQCGMVVGGRRFEDRKMISLSDLLELVRLHTSQVYGH